MNSVDARARIVPTLARLLALSRAGAETRRALGVAALLLLLLGGLPGARAAVSAAASPRAASVPMLPAAAVAPSTPAASRAGAVSRPLPALPPLRLDAASAQLVRQAWQGFQRGDAAPAVAALPALHGSPLEDWVAYWALAPRLRQATPADFESFARHWPGTLPLLRLRAQWLAELGRRQDWPDFLAVYAGYDGDDAQLQCLDAQARFETTGVDTSARVLALWPRAAGGGAGCNSAARSLLAAGHIDQQALWQRMYGFFAAGEVHAALAFTRWLMPDARRLVHAAADDPLHLVLSAPPTAGTVYRRALVLALLRMARQDPQQTMRLLDARLRSVPAAQRGRIAWLAARSASAQLLPGAAGMFRRAGRIAPGWQPDADDWKWCLRAALRAGDWSLVQRAAMRLQRAGGDAAEATYWSAVAASRTGHPRRARELWRSIAEPWNYYGQLATEALGRKVRIPATLPAPAPRSQVLQQALRPGVRQALLLYGVDAYAPAAAQWVAAIHGIDDQQLHAAAQLACQHQAWLLCISASDRMKHAVDWKQRYVMPFRHAVDEASRDTGVSSPFIYGIMRQESGFASGIQSWAGASGLMQLMPGTARWVARKIGLAAFRSDDVTQVRTNIALGSAYLGMLLQRFDGSQAMAAAGYNAGPARPARWRGMPLPVADELDGAIFAESIPIDQTRNYVKQVLSNATVYAALLGTSRRSLKSRLALAQPQQISQAQAMP